VLIDPSRLTTSFETAQRTRASGHTAVDRLSPSMLRYDYLALQLLSDDVRALVGDLPTATGPRRALDLGCDKSPYRGLLEQAHYFVETLDLTPNGGANYVGTAEATGLPDVSFDLVLCTQVLEHTQSPSRVMTEIHRILRPGGYALLSAPHVWFFHPQPCDHWRFTQQGIVRLCRDAELEVRSLRAQGGSLTTAMQVLNFLSYGVLGRAGWPIYASLNLLARVADPLSGNELFCHNFACLAHKRPAA
jgi:SAM-dependent methyltransferase